MATTDKKISLKLSHNLYVVELSRQIWTDNWKFRKANPHYQGVADCLYVGMTSHTPQERFKKHKTRHRNKKGFKISSSIVEKYGLYLRPTLYAQLNPMTRMRATKLEGRLAESLRKQGFAVWWN